MSKAKDQYRTILLSLINWICFVLIYLIHLFDLILIFGLQFPQLVEHSCSARTIRDLNKVFIMTGNQWQLCSLDQFGIWPGSVLECIRIRSRRRWQLNKYKLHYSGIVYWILEVCKTEPFNPEHVHEIYQTRQTVFDHISKRREESWKYDAQRSIFDELRGVWRCGQTRSFVFDISSQSKLKLRRKRKIKIVRISAN